MTLLESLQERHEKHREARRVLSEAGHVRRRIEEKLAEVATEWHIELYQPSVEPMSAEEVRTAMTVWIDGAPLHLTWYRSEYSGYVFNQWSGEVDGKRQEVKLEDLDDYLDEHGVNVLLCALEAELFREAQVTLHFGPPYYELRNMADRSDAGPDEDPINAPAKYRLIRAIGDEESEYANLSRARRGWERFHRAVAGHSNAPWAYYYFGVAIFFGLFTLIASLAAQEPLLGMLGVVFGPFLIGCLEVRDARRDHGSWRKRAKPKVTWALHDMASRDYTGVPG